MSTPPSINWKSDDAFTIDGIDYTMTVDNETMHRLETSGRSFLLCKNKPLVEDIYEASRSNSYKRILEIGIFKGGSVTLYAQLFQPELLIALEYEPVRVDALDDFIADRSLSESVKLHYDIDQEDRAALLAIVEEDLGSKTLDLIIDDGSHQYGKTKSSFETLFPLLRPGGMYVVEDWGWAHWPGDIWQKSQAFPAQSPSVTNLLIEACMLCASDPSIASQIIVEQSLFRVIRGHRAVAPGFSMSDVYLNRGRPFEAIF